MMKVVFTLNRKSGELDWFIRHESGPLPPIITPPDHDKPKDTAPPTPRPPDPKPS
jgi:hypothetical protein